MPPRAAKEMTMAVHEADSYQKKVHQGTVKEAQGRGDLSRMHAPQPTSGKKSKDSGSKPANKGESARALLAQKGVNY
jgi:hypothetical protein